MECIHEIQFLQVLASRQKCLVQEIQLIVAEIQMGQELGVEGRQRVQVSQAVAVQI